MEGDYMKSLLMTLFLMTMTLSQKVFAFDCSEILTHYDNIQIQRSQFSSTDSACFVSIHPMFIKDMKYRDYLLTTDGLFMVFNSYKDGSIASSTGAREYFIFPRNFQKFEIIHEASMQQLIISINDSQNFIFSTATAELMSISGAAVIVDPEITPKNAGGVEIKNFPGILLDSGFRMGGSPTEVSSRSSTFKDINNKSCSIKNSRLFNYENDEVVFAHDDEQLRDFLKAECKNLTWLKRKSH